MLMKTQLNRGVPVTDQLYDILKERIREAVYPPGTKFPSEEELLEEFGVSRITVRRACSGLVDDGLIYRRWGVGTFVSKLARITNPINTIIDFKELISNSGFEPGYKLVNIEITEADEAMSEILLIDEGTKLLFSEKHFMANDELLIIVKSFLPEWVLGARFDQILADPTFLEPLFVFLEEQCNQRIRNMHTTFWPDTIMGLSIDIPNLDKQTPVLIMDHVAYNLDETPIYYSNQIQIGNRMQYNLIRHMESKSY